MNNSEITLCEAIERIEETFAPAKITFNGIVLYNDYDSDVEIEAGVYGETKFPSKVIPDRLWQFDKYIVTSINIKIVEFHHSIITMQGKYKEET